VSEHALTDEQRAIVDAVAAGRTVVVRALAGTGKTSTLVAVARHLQETAPQRRVLYLAFNKVTADEARSRMPSNVQALTSNSMARRGGPAHVGRRVKPQQVRVRDLVERLAVRTDVFVGTTKVATPLDLGRLAVRTMERWCQSAAELPEAAHVPAVTPGDGGEVQRALEQVRYLAESTATGDPGATGEAAVADAWAQVTRRVLAIVGDWWSEVMDPDSDLPISFDQEVKAWALTHPRFDRPGSGASGPVDLVLMDECQDTNEVLGALVQEQSIQQVYVGDQNQAIYGWRGAVDYLDRVTGEVELALTASWRFGPQVAHVANAFLSLLGTRERVVGKGPSATIGRVPDPDAVVCRTNAGLLEAAVEADRAGKTVGVPKGMKRELKVLAETVGWLRDGGRRPMVVHEDLAEFRSWAQVLKESVEEPSGPVARLVKLVDAVPLPTLLRLVERLVEVDQAFKGRPTWDVMVTTAHKAKGLEWDRVQVAGDFPQPRSVDGARVPGRGLGDVEMAGGLVLPSPENLRLAYVAVTRAKVAMDVGSLGYALSLAGDGPVPVAAPRPERAVAAPGSRQVEPREGGKTPSDPAVRALIADLLLAADDDSRDFDGVRLDEIIGAHLRRVRVAERQVVADEIEARASTPAGGAVARFVRKRAAELSGS